MKNRPWEYSDFFATEAEFLGWLRGQLRQIWSDYPIRVEFKNDKCVRVDQALRDKYNLSKQTKYAAECVFCHNWFPKSKLEVDHIIGESSLTSIEHTESYLDHLMCPPTNMQLTCKPCHKIKTYAERYDMSFEDARTEKSVIAWLKEHTTAEQIDLLTMAGFEDDEMKNAGARRKSARKLLKGGS